MPAKSSVSRRWCCPAVISGCFPCETGCSESYDCVRIAGKGSLVSVMGATYHDVRKTRSSAARTKACLAPLTLYSIPQREGETGRHPRGTRRQVLLYRESLNIPREPRGIRQMRFATFGEFGSFDRICSLSEGSSRFFCITGQSATSRKK
jgi:hypothetical protein